MKSARTRVWGALLIAAVAGIGLWFVFTDDDTLCKSDPAVCPCLALVPEDRRFGIKYSTDKKGRLTGVDFDGGRIRAADPSPEWRDRFIDCLNALKRGISIKNHVRLESIPLGQIANIWRREQGLRLRLISSDNSEGTIINNLKFGPDSGTKWEVVQAWCDPLTFGRCVQCNPTKLDRDTVEVEVEVELAKNPPLQKYRWSSGWPKNVKDAEGKSVNSYKPWELVDHNGDRYLYRCEPNS